MYGKKNFKITSLPNNHTFSLRMKIFRTLSFGVLKLILAEGNLYLHDAIENASRFNLKEIKRRIKELKPQREYLVKFSTSTCFDSCSCFRLP